MEEKMKEASEIKHESEILILAVNHSSLTSVEEQLAKGVDPNVTDKDGTPALHFACNRGKLDITKLLISKGADINSEDSRGRTALHYAAYKDRLDIVKYLIQKGSWLDIYDANDDTPLHLAVRQGHKAVSNHLLMQGAKTTIHNNHSLTALGEAISCKNSEMAQLLIDKGADLHAMSKGFSMLHVAAGTGSEKITAFVLNYLDPLKVPCTGGITPLHCAAYSGSSEVVRLLLKKGCDLKAKDKDNRYPIDWVDTHLNANSEIMELLSVRSSEKKKKPIVTEIETDDEENGPMVSEWQQFQNLSREEKLKKIEEWASSPQEYIDKLNFMDEDSRKAIAKVGHFMRMLEFQRQLRRFKIDDNFVQEIADPGVMEIIKECSTDTKKMEKYESDEKMNRIFSNLKKISHLISQNAHMRSVYNDMLSLSKEEQNLEKKDPTSIETLENYLKEAKEAVIKSVVDTERSKNKLNSNNDKKMSSWKFWQDERFWKGLYHETIRSIIMTIVVLILMCIIMYFFELFPWQNANWKPKNPMPLESNPAKLTKDMDIHKRIAEGTYRHKEL